jgi:hypothetical protein
MLPRSLHFRICGISIEEVAYELEDCGTCSEMVWMFDFEVLQDSSSEPARELPCNTVAPRVKKKGKVDCFEFKRGADPHLSDAVHKGCSWTLFRSVVAINVQPSCEESRQLSNCIAIQCLG